MAAGPGTQLFRGERVVESVFGIHGAAENDLTAGLAVVLSRSPLLLRSILKDLVPTWGGDIRGAVIRVQRHRRGHGTTDVEILIPGQVFVVIEAKVGSELPSSRQLRRYAVRCKESACIGGLVALTSSDDVGGHIEGGIRPFGRVPVRVRSWRWVRRHVRSAQAQESARSVGWLLDEYSTFLEDFMGLDGARSNIVFVVSLGSGLRDGWLIPPIEVKERHRKYFYPFNQKGWPVPPNYIAFRHGGRLRSIHHVESWKVDRDLRPYMTPRSNDHYLLDLGPPISPLSDVRTGKRVFRSARVWCMLDTLLTSKTISEALTVTKQRLKKADADS